jgi:C_GCAxxG_C_C family probable redox protein
MTEDKINEIVYENYANGFHCAESIVNTINEILPGKNHNFCKAASGFCGGIGACKQEVCGALSGGIIALGSIYGRQVGSVDNSKLVSLSSKFRQIFNAEFGATVCQNVIANLENLEGLENCKDLTAKTSWLLYNLIENQ